MRGMRKIGVIVALVVIVLAAAVVPIWLQRADARHQIIAQAVPNVPDLSAASPALRSRIGDATNRIAQPRGSVAGLAELSRLYHANGFLAEAARCYQGLEQLQASEPQWPHRHAAILAGYGEVEPALVLWQRVVKLAPTYLPARIRLADAFLKNNQPEKAAAAYQEVLRQQANDPYALFGLARLDWEGGRLDQARERLENVVKQTNFELGYDLIVSVYERLGSTEKANAIRGTKKASGAYREITDPWMDALLADCFDPYRLTLAAGLADRKGDSTTAVQFLERAIQLAPQDVAVRFQLGGVYLQRGELKSAVQQFTSCTSIAPDFADAWIYLADAFEKLSDATSAYRVVLTGLGHCPDSPGLHLARARQLRKGKQIEEAGNEFKTSIRLRPNEAAAYIELGSMYIEIERVADGVGQLRKALEAEPEHPGALSILAFHAIASRDESEARQWLARVKRQPRVPKEQAATLFTAYRETFGHEF